MKNHNKKFSAKNFQLLLIPVFFLLTGISILHLININYPLRSADHKFNQQQNERINQTFPVLYCPEAPLLLRTGTKKSGKNKVQIDKNWYNTVIENIKNDEYNITFNDQTGSYQSPNRANDIRFIYHKDGFTALTRDVKRETQDGYCIDLRLSNVNRHKSNEESGIRSYESGMFEGNELKVENNKASIEDNNLRINYINNEEGMRQDFIIKNKPDGEGNLRLDLNVDTKLKMIIGADALMFKDSKGECKMKYSALKAWDANGKELHAYFEKNSELQISNDNLKIEDKKSQIRNSKSQIQKNYKFLSIVLNDKEAVYPVTIDPLSTTPNWTAESNYSNSNFGMSVATAGDVNGDGFSDVIVGAPNYDNGSNQLNEGKVFVFHGSSSGLSSTANWTKESNQANAQFGFCVSTAGDVNGDGYSDVIIGAPNYELNGPPEEGWAFIYSGSSSGLETSSNFSIMGGQASAHLGYSVSTAGDVNGDGYSDVIAGAPNYDTWSGYDQGLVRIRYGASGGMSNNYDSIKGFSTSGDAQFGFSVSTAGDVNGDGYSDVIVGAPLDSSDQAYEGKSYVYHGSSSGVTSTADWTAEGNSLYSFFGWSVSTAGDVNGDGYSDVIAGAPNFTNGQAQEGKIFVYHGSASGLSDSANRTIEGNQLSAQLGFSVSTAGDVNGDGYCDIIAGAPYPYNPETGEGKAFVYRGSLTGLSSVIWTVENNQIGAHYGYSVSTAGDVNGDGYSDVISGAPDFESEVAQTNEGKALTYQGSPSGLSNTSFWFADGDQQNAQFGFSVSSAGDVNGDGYSDVIVGAPFYDNGQTDKGKAFVFHGSGSGLTATESWSAEGNQQDAYFGWSVSTAGDINGDGFCDVIIGAYVLDKVYVYLGSSVGLFDVRELNGALTSGFGYSVSSAGDVNGDGYSDVIVGAFSYTNGELGEGGAFVYYGSDSGISSTANWSAKGNQEDAHFGSSVSNAGDVNGDGFSDVIVGAPYFNNEETDEGRSFIYHGSSSGLSAAPNWTAESNTQSAFFGISVSVAGDVNGDGYSDVIIGASNFDSKGKAFVYQGSSSGLSSTVNWSFSGNNTSDLFGISVATAGDVNGDGYSDVIAGASQFTNGQNYEGSAFVFHGSQSGLSATSNWYAERNQENANFGISVSSAGDVNGDGYSDVIIGANLYDTTETDEGSVFVYYGNETTGLRSTVQQYKPNLDDIVYSGGLTGTNGEAGLGIFGKSPFGRVNGKIVYEYKRNAFPFSSGFNITNSVSFSGSGDMADLGTTIDGIELKKSITGVELNREYKWRARVQYSLANNPYQKFGPWKYYTNFVPEPFGCFKAQNTPLSIVPPSILNIRMFIEGFYNSSSDQMVADTVRIYLRTKASPFSIADSSVSVVNYSGNGTYTFNLAQNEIPYYIQLKHRNSIETWSDTTLSFASGSMSYDFTDAVSKAYGNNMIQVDFLPAAFAIYSGDVNQDGFIDLVDVLLVANDASIYLSGYFSTDVNGDGNVDLADILIAYNNASGFVTVVRP